MNNFFASAKLISVAASLLLLLAVSTAFSQNDWNLNTSPLPPTNNAVNDYVGVFDEATKAALEKKLRDYRQSSGVTLVVAVIKTTGDRPIFDYSLAVYRGWKVGSTNDDNPGALLLVAVDDRKYFTQVGRDLEDELPDGLAGSLQRQYLVPEFRKGNYAKGISDTINAYILTIDQRRSGIAESPTPAPPEPDSSGSQTLYSAFCCLVVIGVILLIVWSNRNGGRGGKSRRDQDRWGGGFGGGSSALPWIIGSAIGSSGGSSSSDWGSSSWGGGGGGSSDWGGFGGGDAGGGGAGGDW